MNKHLGSSFSLEEEHEKLTQEYLTLHSKLIKVVDELERLKACINDVIEMIEK